MGGRPSNVVSFFFIGLMFFLFGLYWSDLFDSGNISKAVIENGSKLNGLVFQEAEQDSMVDGLNELLENYNQVRAVELDNAVVPALQFNPIPQGWSGDRLPGSFRLSDYSNTRLPENRDDLAFYSIGELAHLIKIKKITSEEITEYFLQRLKKYGPKLECVITLNEQGALEQARKADMEIRAGKYRGVLHGIPYGIKDLFAIKGLKTTWGAKPYINLGDPKLPQSPFLIVPKTRTAMNRQKAGQDSPKRLSHPHMPCWLI